MVERGTWSRPERFIAPESRLPLSLPYATTEPVAVTEPMPVASFRINMEEGYGDVGEDKVVKTTRTIITIAVLLRGLLSVGPPRYPFSGSSDQVWDQGQVL